MQLDGQIALITGGASGIGEGTARLFAERGATVVIADLQEDRGQSLANEIDGTFARVDVTSEADVSGAVDSTVERYGRLDCIFNNAGFGGALGPIDETSECIARQAGRQNRKKNVSEWVCVANSLDIQPHHLTNRSLQTPAALAVFRCHSR